MKNLGLLLAATLFIGCATGKMGKVDKPLEPGLITKATPIYVYPVTTKNIFFKGDKSKEAKRIDQEKGVIEHRYGGMIVAALAKLGYKAEVTKKKMKKGILVKANVSQFNHGSAAARAMVGMGAGSSNLFTDFSVVDGVSSKTLSKFEVIATSGGRGGFGAMGSFMNAHLEDGAKKAAEYLSGKR